MVTLYERLSALCEEKGIKGGRMCVELGFSKSLMTDLKTGRKKSINAETAQKIASYFEVSVDYLLGKTNIKKDPAKSEVEDGYYLLANRNGEGKGIEKLTKSEYEALVAVIKTLRNNANEDL